MEATGPSSEIHESHISITLKMPYTVLGFGVSLKANPSSDPDYFDIMRVDKLFSHNSPGNSSREIPNNCVILESRCLVKEL